MHDLPKYARMQKQMEFVAHEMANILQNKGNKKITKDDIKYAMAGAYLSIYPGTTMYSVTSAHQKNIYGHFPHGDLYCVKRTNGQNNILWKITCHTSRAITPKGMTCDQRSNPASIGGVNLNDISIEEGQIKMILHCYCFFYQDGNRYLLNGNSTLSITAREAFGFSLLEPKGFVRNSAEPGFSAFFPVIVIFTPKPGLFDDTAP
jgi:hypothetical protein